MLCLTVQWPLEGIIDFKKRFQIREGFLYDNGDEDLKSFEGSARIEKPANHL